MRAAWPILTLLCSASIPGQTDLALVGGTIYVSPTEEPIKNGVVLIQRGKISAVGSRALLQVPSSFRSLNCSGRTITAGFWNSHVHFFERKWEDAAAIPGPELSLQLQEMVTRYGFTSVFDVGSVWQNTRRIRDRIESGELPGPGIRSMGEVLIAPGAAPAASVLGILGYMTLRNPEIADAAQATEATRKLLDAGVDGIKVHLQTAIPESAIRAAVTEANRAGKPVFVHPSTRQDVLTAVRAGADVIAHTTPRSPWNEETIAAMKGRRVALIPTLSLWKHLLRHDRTSAQEQSINAAIAQLRSWVAAEGTVLFGTDLGATEYDPSDEYTFMAASGMSFTQILAALTTVPAQRFGVEKQLGRIAVGLEADLVALKDDPTKNIRALSDVRYTLRAGKIIFRSGL